VKQIDQMLYKRRIGAAGSQRTEVRSGLMMTRKRSRHGPANDRLAQFASTTSVIGPARAAKRPVAKMLRNNDVDRLAAAAARWPGWRSM
jgi:hypothetical protein